MLVTVLARALAKQPASRYQHVHGMIGDLQVITGGASASQPLRPDDTARRRIPWYLYAGGAAVLCGLVVAVFLLAGSPPAPSPIRAIAVLPFRSTSARLDDTVFAEGMTTALSTELSKIRALVVRSSRSAMRFKNSDKPVAEIAHELNVDALIDGSTQLTGTTARVSVNLITINPEQQIWGESYREHIEDINTLQSSIAQAVVQKLQVVLTPDEAAQLARRKSVNAEAYQACMYGRFYWNKYTPESFQKSLVFFRMAAKKDPLYAPAYAGIADVYATLWYNGNVPFDTVEPHWRPAAQKAVDLDPMMAEGHVSLAATRLVYDWDWTGAEQGLRHALSLNPSYATGHTWYALLLSALGRHDSALVEIRRAQTLDPLSVVIAASAGWIHIYALRYDEAIAQFRTALELDTNCAPAHSGLGEIYELQGRNQEALEEYLRVARVSGGSFATLGGGTEDAVSRLRSAYLASGWNGYWNELLRQLEQLARRRFVS
ncbi:MAG TPA: tetratricopeptide repeat protein, partial [Bacteroidota bacterium]|nr:tetratricopeptide repeat protein [Bacteroidota bacterium]